MPALIALLWAKRYTRFLGLAILRKLRIPYTRVKTGKVNKYYVDNEMLREALELATLCSPNVATFLAAQQNS